MCEFQVGSNEEYKKLNMGYNACRMCLEQVSDIVHSEYEVLVVVELPMWGRLCAGGSRRRSRRLRLTSMAPVCCCRALESHTNGLDVQ